MADNPLAETISLPRLVIAAPQGRSVKTTLSLGICAALAGRGLAVQPFKKGPDYIDPSWLSEAAGCACRSLDPFFLKSTNELRAAFLKGGRQADISLVEGNHGLYDSIEEDGHGSSAAVARTLQAPVILVVNAARMSRSAAAMVHGYQTFEPDTPIRAVILNNVAQGRHLAKLRQAIESYCHIPVIGALPRDAAMTIPDRHLGLVPRSEDAGLLPAIEACRQAVESFVDLKAVMEIAGAAPAWEATPELLNQMPFVPAQVRHEQRKPTIGVMRDQAFSFYYPENLEALEEQGVRLKSIDALNDPHLPDIDALYIGGGFPELFLEKLSQNRLFRQEIRQAVEDGLPVYAECGGLMYLSSSITYAGQKAEMTDVLPCEVEMTATPQGHGYVLAECVGENPFFAPGVRLRGHEFHNSRLMGLPAGWPTALRLERGAGIGGQRDGLVYRNIFASYMHVHASGAPGWAESLAAQARNYATKLFN
jgi:cobyrinic acid a,c-diamide synthase